MPSPKQYDAAGLDLGPRVLYSTTVTGSPADDAETIVCTLPAIPDLFVTKGVALIGWCAFTVGTNGVSVVTRIRRTNAAGTAIAASGATNEGVTAATQLGQRSIVGFDTGPTLPGQVYVMTLTLASASAASTVSAAGLVAIVV